MQPDSIKKTPAGSASTAMAIRIDPATLVRLLIRIAHLHPPWHLALDRTDWRFGNTAINLLVLAIVTRRVRLPILFIVLKKAGCEPCR